MRVFYRPLMLDHVIQRNKYFSLYNVDFQAYAQYYQYSILRPAVPLKSKNR